MTATASGGSPFVGRAHELAQLRGWLAEAQAGHGRMIVLRGEPGMGKTRLAEELAVSAAAKRIPVVWGRCSADSGAPPLWPLRRIAEQLPGQREPLPSGDFDAFGSSAEGSSAARFSQTVWLTDAVVAAAGVAGLLVILEDLHWADSATAGVLGHLASEARRSRALVVCTARLSSTSDSGPVAAILDRASLEQQQLSGLDRDEIADFLSAVSGGPVDQRYAELVLRQTAGNSLYVGVVARLLSERISLRSYDAARSQAALSGRPELLGLIREPMARLSAESRQLVEWASVAGEEFGIIELAVALGVSPDTANSLVDEAVENGLLTRPADAPETARFVHALLRDGVYSNVGRQQQCRAHRAWAQAISTTDRASERIGMVARHLARGASTPGQYLQAATCARRAGQSALADLAYAEAATHFGSALYSMGMAGGRSATERSEVLLDLAFAEYRSGGFGSALAHCIEVADLAESQHRWDLLARAALLVDGVALGGDSLLALYRRALAVLPDSELSLRAQLEARLAYAAVDQGDVDSAQPMSADALALAEQTDDPAALIAGLRARHQALAGAGYAAERLVLGERAIALAARGEPLAALWGRLWRVDAAFELGDLVVVDQELTALARLTEELRFPLARWHLLRLRAAREGLVGRFALAEEQARAARDLSGELEDASVVGLYYAFLIFLAYTRGGGLQEDGKDVVIDDFLAIAAGIPLPIVHTSTALAMVCMGDLDEAARIARRLTPEAAGWAMDGRWIVTMSMLADVIADVRDEHCAEMVYPMLEPFAGLVVAGGAGTVACEGSVSRRLGRLATTLDRLDVAEGHLRDAIALEDAMGAAPFAATSRMYLSSVLHVRGGGQTLAAGQSARSALAAMQAIGMPGRAAQCKQVLAAIDAAVADRTALTPRESEIVALVAQGLPNRQIAEQLFLSERTVETHVSHVLAKLGAATRTEIATWAVAGGIAPAHR